MKFYRCELRDCISEKDWKALDIEELREQYCKQLESFWQCAEELAD